jgi:hypothetical protein
MAALYLNVFVGVVQAFQKRRAWFLFEATRHSAADNN